MCNITCHPFLFNVFVCFRCVGREQTVFVRNAFPTGDLLVFALSQGADADDFNPDRFIDANGQVTPALADTKVGTAGFGHSLIHLLHVRRR